ncbi:non-homologous end joining protein Ku [Flavobacterium seoulense]|uniref:Non-homologous end joining protein Ku n=1 Tax=Flavobacterium seoulense TaxID=1492738 RepID=A0A066WP58_9FLAO|nr:Ku protein [Flavobacterium seoulense]KDN55661.1 DNA repair protein [Flavobacterium seoulense]
MRAIWTGSISFGLINIPIKIFSAIQESTLDMDMLDEKDHANIKFKRVNENTGKEVSFANIVKGYKLEEKYIILEDADFEAADAVKTKTIDIQSFAFEKEINSIYYEQPYYLEPDKGAMNAYALLRDALEKSGKVGVTSFVLRNKESLAILKPYKNVILLNKIRFEQEIRDTADLKLPAVSKAKTKEMDMATKLIDQLTEKFDISNFKDEYTAKLLKIIKNKAKGKKNTTPKLKVVHKQSDDLMSMLKASLEKKKTS